MTINEAIFNVLRAQFKKELVNGELDYLRRYGLTAVKENKRFTVRKRGEYIRDMYIYDGINYCLETFNGVRRVEYRFKNAEDMFAKFDFIGFLEKPANTDYLRAQEYKGTFRVYGGNTPTQQKTHILKCARANVVSNQNQVARLQAEIEALQTRLNEAIRQEKMAEKKLTQIRKEFKLAE